MKVLFGMFAAFRRSVPFSLRLQQAVYYTGAFTIVLILTGAVFYNYLETALEAGVDTALHLRVQQIAGSLEFQHGKIVPVDGTVALPGFGLTPSTQLASPEDLNQETFIRLLDAHGVLLGETPSFRPLDVPVVSITQPLRGTPWQGTIATSNDREIRIYSRALVAQGKNVAVIQVGESLVSLHELLHQLVAALFIVGFLVLLACATGSYWLAGRSFAPIKRLAETARKIKADDLHQRVPVPSVRDEVQYLALTFNEMLDSLERSFSQQRRFVADASHELRTPVAAICNKAEVALLRTRSQDEYGRILQSIYTESERLGHLINSLLTLARSDEGQAYFEYELVHLDLIIESVLANAEELAEERRIKLTFDASSSVNLLGDEARLIEVFINLVENALSYTNPGGQVSVQLTASSSSVQVAIQDTGIGIAPEHLTHIFERFYRVDLARRHTKSSSSGLGLSIVEWIVRAHGGCVEVESEPGRGSCFTVILPLHSTFDGSLKRLPAGNVIWRPALTGEKEEKA